MNEILNENGNRSSGKFILSGLGPSLNQNNPVPINKANTVRPKNADFLSEIGDYSSTQFPSHSYPHESYRFSQTDFLFFDFPTL